MGFLRKIGRKIKKGVKKLFSSKIGSFIGSIGLSMMMGPVISRAFNGIKGVFTGATQAGTQAATTATTAATTGTTAGAGATATSEAAKTVAVEGAKDVAAKGVIDNTVTGALEKINDSSFADTLVQQAQESGLKGQIPKPSKFTVSDVTIPKPSPLPKPTLGQEIGNKFTDFGTGVKEFTADPFGKTKEYLGDSFVPDAVQSVAMSGIKSALTPEYEAPFQSKGVQNVGSDIQSSYMKEVQTQVPNMRATNFNQLNQSLFFGTLSPQYLAQQAQQYS